MFPVTSVLQKSKVAAKGDGGTKIPVSQDDRMSLELVSGRKVLLREKLKHLKKTKVGEKTKQNTMLF